MSKYGNVKSRGFDSRLEERRYNELCLMKKGGYIHNLECQKEYILIPSQRVDGKVIERACKYRADFDYYTKDGIHVVEDAKGFKTKDYIIKRKLMLWVHGIRVKEVKR